MFRSSRDVKTRHVLDDGIVCQGSGNKFEVLGIQHRSILGIFICAICFFITEPGGYNIKAIALCVFENDQTHYKYHAHIP